MGYFKNPKTLKFLLGLSSRAAAAQVKHCIYRNRTMQKNECLDIENQASHFHGQRD